ncbi:MAG: sulfatase [Novosphingobium sp.]
MAFAAPKPARKQNFIIVLCDDMGYGDIEPTGGKTIPTPNLNRMAREGMVLTDYYAPANICTPSRAGLLTGRYPIRTGLAIGVILVPDKRMLPLSETTIPKALKPAGYVSGLFGKWHLGHLGPDWQPTKHGFDKFFGIPYSHDMMPLTLVTDNSADAEPSHEPPVMADLQQRFYDAAEKFIEDNADKPFFVELALSAPHLASYPNAKYRDPKMQSAYGEVVEEIDAIMGRLLAKLKALKLDRDTMVIFTSDNGPWHEGSTGGLRDRKGGAGFDGGYRVPCIAWQPGTVEAGRRTDSIAMGIDFLPTFCAMAGLPRPVGVELDGQDISAVLKRGAPSPHEALLLFNETEVVAVRTQRWKYVTRSYYHGYLMPIDGPDSPQLYDMKADISESYSAAERNPEALATVKRLMADARAKFGPLKAAQQLLILPGMTLPPGMNGARQD